MPHFERQRHVDSTANLASDNTSRRRGPGTLPLLPALRTSDFGFAPDVRFVYSSLVVSQQGASVRVGPPKLGRRGGPPCVDSFFHPAASGFVSNRIGFVFDFVKSPSDTHFCSNINDLLDLCLEHVFPKLASFGAFRGALNCQILASRSGFSLTINAHPNHGSRPGPPHHKREPKSEKSTSVRHSERHRSLVVALSQRRAHQPFASPKHAPIRSDPPLPIRLAERVCRHK